MTLSFEPDLAARRFGCGLSPVIAPPISVEAMLEQLIAPDSAAQRFPIEHFETFRARLVARRDGMKALRQAAGQEAKDAQREIVQRLTKDAAKDAAEWMRAHLARMVWSTDGFRERLRHFWADHFAVRGRNGVLRSAVSPYAEEAIRPHIGGRFEDMLFAAVTHPVMVDYLDQRHSMGENSPAAARRRSRGLPAGLNENLAREILELHTLGVGADYAQSDVRALANLLTGLSYDPGNGRKFVTGQAEPGPKQVLGKTYGGGRPGMDDIRAVLRDLALHEATALHVARKLAVHFVSDEPSPALVEAMAAAYSSSGGALLEVYHAMLRHPDAWLRENPNVLPPFVFLGAAMRSLAIPAADLVAMTPAQTRRVFYEPLAAMGHLWERPSGPDGIFEDDAVWITPQALAMRVQWAMQAPSKLMRALPDPRKFVRTALGGKAPPPVEFAARNAESVSEAIGLVLVSPAFQRA